MMNPVFSSPAAVIPPGKEELHALDELVDLGYVRGILNKLGEIERTSPASGEFVIILRNLARQFQFDAMKEILKGPRCRLTCPNAIFPTLS